MEEVEIESWTSLLRQPIELRNFLQLLLGQEAVGVKKLSCVRKCILSEGSKPLESAAEFEPLLRCG